MVWVDLDAILDSPQILVMFLLHSSLVFGLILSELDGSLSFLLSLDMNVLGILVFHQGGRLGLLLIQLSS